MKNLILIMIMAVMVCGVSFADEGNELFSLFNSILPNTTTGIFYDVVQSKLVIVGVAELFEKETPYGTFCLNAGLGESDYGIAGISYKTETLSKLGINVLVLKDLFAQLGYSVGVDGFTTGDHRLVHGPLATLGANIKF